MTTSHSNFILAAKRADAAADVSAWEREAVYEAVVALVRTRLEKAQSV
jgi:hypothetical protein